MPGVRCAIQPCNCCAVEREQSDLGAFICTVRPYFQSQQKFPELSILEMEVSGIITSNTEPQWNGLVAQVVCVAVKGGCMWKLSHLKGLKCRVMCQGILKDYYLLNCLLTVCIVLNFCGEDVVHIYFLDMVIEDLGSPSITKDKWIFFKIHKWSPKYFQILFFLDGC